MDSVAKAPPRAKLERMVVRASDGRVWDLGSPDSSLFRLRVARYRWQRRREFRSQKESLKHG